MKHIFAITAALAIVGPVMGQESAADWIAKLGSGSYAERELAARKLEAIGKAALPLLNQLAENADLETKRRAAVIVERIIERAFIADVLTATPMRFQVRDMPVSEALREIEKQFGLRCGLTSKKNRISVDTGKLPYWQAWERFRQTAGLQESDYTLSAAKLKSPSETTLEELTALLNRRDFDIAPHFFTPRLQFDPEPASTGFARDDRHSIRVRVKALETSLIERTPHTTFAVEVRAEPRLDIVAMPKAEITKIVDEAGRAHEVQAVKLLPEAFVQAQSADFLAAFIGEVQYGGLLHLRWIPLPGSPRKLKELHGHVRVQVQVKPPLLEVPNVLKAAGTQVRGKQGVTLKVLNAAKTDEGDLQLRLFMDQLDSLTPKTLEQQIVRLRSGVVAIRGTMDVALDRLQLYDRRGMTFERTIVRYEQVKNGTGYIADVSFAAQGAESDELTLVMTEQPRKILVQMPFVVRDVVVPAVATGKGS